MYIVYMYMYNMTHCSDNMTTARMSKWYSNITACTCITTCITASSTCTCTCIIRLTALYMYMYNKTHCSVHV